MDALAILIIKTSQQVLTSFEHNWPFLLCSILVAVLLKLYLNPDQVSAFLLRHRKAGVVGATAAAVGTPLCSCGTTAIVLGMMASMLPWAPIVAFMVASPLTSPEELVYSAGLFGWPFALAFFIASILLGLLGGFAAGILERNGWLSNQTRFNTTPQTSSRSAKTVETCACPVQINLHEPALAACGCGSNTLSAAINYDKSSDVLSLDNPCTANCKGITQPARKSISFQIFFREVFDTARNLLPLFLSFAFIGYFLNNLIPAAWISAIFGQGHIYSVPLAATLGVPLYINTEGSLPLVRALIDGGMSQGAALAFLITGAGTSVGAIAGALTIARWRVIALVIATLWVGAILIGYAYNLLLVMRLF